MSYVITSRPSVSAVFRLLPAYMPDLFDKSGISKEHVRNAVKLLLATKQAYVSAWSSDLQPLIAAGNQPNAPRPTPQLMALIRLGKRRDEYADKRAEYQRQYREANKEKRTAYNRANKDYLNAKRNERYALKRAIARSQLVAQDEVIKTVWRTT
jgi:multidrug efflux pump subunit AcrA (membrane-fusion protein)